MNTCTCFSILPRGQIRHEVRRRCQRRRPGRSAGQRRSRKCVQDTMGMLCLLSLPLFLFTTDYSTARQLPQLALPQECLSVSDQGLLASDSPVERKIRPMEWLAGGLFASQTSVRTSQKGLKASQTVMRTIQKAVKISQNSDQ